MSKLTDTRREHYVKLFYKVGIRLDEAHACADVAIRAGRNERDDLIRDCYRAGLSLRRLAKRLRMSKSQVQRVVSPDSSDSGTPINSTLPPAA